MGNDDVGGRCSAVTKVKQVQGFIGLGKAKALVDLLRTVFATGIVRYQRVPDFMAAIRRKGERNICRRRVCRNKVIHVERGTVGQRSVPYS